MLKSRQLLPPRGGGGVALRLLRKLPVRTRSFLLSLAGLLTVLGFAGYLSARALRENTEYILAERMLLAEQLAAHVDHHLEMTFALLEETSLREGFDLGDASLEPERHALQKLYQSGVFSCHVFIADGDGVVLLTEPHIPEKIGEDLSGQAYITSALQTGLSQVSDLFVCPEPLATTNIAFVFPVKGPSGEVVGLLGGVSDPNSQVFAQIVGDLSMPGTNHADLLDRNGMVLASTNPQYVLKESRHRLCLLPSLRDRRAGINTCVDENDQEEKIKEVVALTSLSNAPWSLSIEQPETEVLASVHELRERLILVAVVSSLVAAGFVIINSQATVAPIRQLRDAAQRITSGDLNTPVTVTGKDEIATLEASLEEMRQQLASHREQLENEVASRTQHERLLARYLRTSEQRYRSLFDQAHDAVFILDLEGNHLDANRRAAQMLGYAPAELQQLSVKDISAQLTQSDQIREKLLGGEQLPLYERFFRKKDGTLLPVEINVELVRDADDRPQYIQSVVRDISQRIQAENQLRLQSAALEAAANAIVITDIDGAIQWVNPAFTDLTGYTPGEAIGRNPRLLKSGEQAPNFYKELWETISAGGVWQGQLINRRKDGSTYIEEQTITPVRDAQGEICHFIAIKQDVSARVQAKQELQRNAQQFETLYEIGRDLTGEMDLSKLLEKVVAQATDLFETDVSGIYLVDAGRGELEMAAVTGYDVPTGARLRLGEGMAGRVAETRQPLVVEDYRTWEGRSPQYAGVEFTSVLQVPMLYAGELVGVLAINEMAPKIRHFTKEDEELLSLLATSAAGAVHSARAFGAAQRRLEHLASLRTIDRAISGVLDMGTMLRLILGQLSNQLKIDAACVLLHDPQLHNLDYGAGQGFETDTLKHTSLRVGEGFAGRAVLERRMIHIENLNERDTGFLASPHFKAEGFVTYLGVPLIAKGRVTGVLEVFQRTALQPDQEWLSFLDTLAGQVAIAIDNINMFSGLQRAHQNLALAYDSTLEGWARALEYRDMETEGHSRRVTEMTMKLAQSLGIHGAEITHLRRGALLHDIGKMAIPDSILRKPGPLTEEEWAIMRQHPHYAFELLAPIEYLRPALDIPRYHHEKWDGSGYPRGLKGEQIPFVARVFAVVDVWDALSSDRPYREAWPREKVLAYLREQSGGHFDPRVVEAFLKMVER